MRIEKKAWPEYFQAILDGRKTFDMRLADFECQEGDTLVLLEWDPDQQRYTGRSLQRRITYVLRTRDCEFWPTDAIERHGFQVISLERGDPPEKSS